MSSHGTEDVPLEELIIRRTLEALSVLEEFDPHTVERLGELGKAGRLDNWESIVLALSGEEGSQAHATP